MITALGREHRAPSRPQLWHITERATFAALRQSTHRARKGPVTATWLPPPRPAEPPRVGFAIGRSAGNAVARNRIRRRLRAALRAIHVEGHLPAGTYLIGARAEVADLGWDELVAMVAAVVASATAGARP